MPACESKTIKATLYQAKQKTKQKNKFIQKNLLPSLFCPNPGLFTTDF